jgi:serine/threonine protein kinase
VIAFEMICGRRPFPDANNPAALMTALLTEALPLPSSIVVIPDAVDQFVLRCLERDPDRRYQTMLEVRDAIDDALAAPRSSRPPRVAQLHPVSLSLHALTMVPGVAVPVRSVGQRVITYALGAAIAAVGATITWVALS